MSTKDAPLSAVHVDALVGRLIAMHNNPPCKIGWMEQTTLHEACEALTKMRAALDWYAEMAKMMQRATLHVDNQVALHVMKQMALDGGKTAREALTPNARDKPRGEATSA